MKEIFCQIIVDYNGIISDSGWLFSERDYQHIIKDNTKNINLTIDHLPCTKANIVDFLPLNNRYISSYYRYIEIPDDSIQCEVTLLEGYLCSKGKIKIETYTNTNESETYEGILFTYI